MILLLMVLLTFISLPWIFAYFNIWITDIPILGSIFLGKQIVRGFWGGDGPAVHLGMHHGLEGYRIVLLLLLLYFSFRWVKELGLKSILILTTAPVFIYNLYLLFQDFWLEQVYKRGWISFKWNYPVEKQTYINLIMIGAVLGVLICINLWIARKDNWKKLRYSGFKAK